MLCLIRRNGLVLYETLAGMDELAVVLELSELTFRVETFRRFLAARLCEDRKSTAAKFQPRTFRLMLLLLWGECGIRLEELQSVASEKWFEHVAQVKRLLFWDGVDG